MGWLATDKQQRQPKIDVPAGAFTAGGSFASRLSVHVHQPTLGVFQTPQLRAVARTLPVVFLASVWVSPNRSP